MEKLLFDHEVFDAGAGKIYQMLINIAMPAMVFGVLEIALINSGGMAQFADYPEWVKWIFILITAVYVVPSLFVFPTAWMLRSWKKSSLKDNYVKAGRKSVEYHKVENIMGDPRENVYVATQIKKVEETRTKLIIKGNIQEQATGNRSEELVIPKAFEHMDLIKRAARYR
ncbi:MAG: hypothetical protein IJ110_00590 [Lachnospiraceae bacterium]|nr:hypothetical protein [Lachnospiraceae bacterium]